MTPRNRRIFLAICVAGGLTLTVLQLLLIPPLNDPEQKGVALAALVGSALIVIAIVVVSALSLRRKSALTQDQTGSSPPTGV